MGFPILMPEQETESTSDHFSQQRRISSRTASHADSWKLCSATYKNLKVHLYYLRYTSPCRIPISYGGTKCKLKSLIAGLLDSSILNVK